MLERKAPDLALRRGAEREALEHPHDSSSGTLAPLFLDAVDRVRGGLTVELEQREELGTGAATPVLGVGEAMVLPPVLVPRKHARPLRAKPLVDLAERLVRLVHRDEPPSPCGAGIVAQRETRAVGLHLHARRGEPVPEAPVDRALRGPEPGDRLPHSFASASCCCMNPRRIPRRRCVGRTRRPR